MWVNGNGLFDPVVRSSAKQVGAGPLARAVLGASGRTQQVGAGPVGRMDK